MSETSKEELQIVQANNEFSKKLYKVLAEEGRNVIFSPISVHTVLSMSYQGAQGKTAESLASVLQVPDARSTSEGYEALMKRFNDVCGVTLLMANKIFLSEGRQLLEEFDEVIKKNFLSEVQLINFENKKAAARTINKWVEKQTKKEIRELIQKEMLNIRTKLVLINAVFFKGGWKWPFDPKATTTAPFYISEEEYVEVEIMRTITNKCFPYKNDSDLECVVVQLPYCNEDFSLIIILPDDWAMSELEEKLEAYDLSKLTENMIDDEEIPLFLVKFRIEQTIDLKESLKKLGLEEMFHEHQANFKGIIEMDGNENLYVNEIVQKAFFEVDEQGSKAAASTEESMGTFMCGPEPIFVNKPFIFLIKMKDCVIFMGKIVRPLYGSADSGEAIFEANYPLVFDSYRRGKKLTYLFIEKAKHTVTSKKF